MLRQAGGWRKLPTVCCNCCRVLWHALTKLVQHGSGSKLGTEQEISSSYEHLEGDTKDACFLVSILQVAQESSPCLSSFPKSTLHAWVAFLVSIWRRDLMNR